MSSQKNDMSASNELDFDFDDFEVPMAAEVSLDELLKRFIRLGV